MKNLFVKKSLIIVFEKNCVKRGGFFDCLYFFFLFKKQQWVANFFFLKKTTKKWKFFLNLRLIHTEIFFSILYWYLGLVYNGFSKDILKSLKKWGQLSFFASKIGQALGVKKLRNRKFYVFSMENALLGPFVKHCRQIEH